MNEYVKICKDNMAYIDEHRANVKKAYDYLVENGIINDNSLDLRKNIEKHDISKTSYEEFEPYAMYFFSNKRDEVYKQWFNRAWLHHIHNNPHHWNYWVLVDGVGNITALEMPEIYVYEMICDWLSFSIKNGDLTEIKSFYDKKRNEYIFHPNTKKLVEKIINDIVDKAKERK